MKRKIDTTQPWHQPGYRFSIDWPPGFEPHYKPSAQEQAAARVGRLNSEKRERGEAGGFSADNGTIWGLSDKANEMAIRRKVLLKNSKL